MSEYLQLFKTLVWSYSKFDTCLQSSTWITILHHFIISKRNKNCNINQQVYKFKYPISKYLSNYDTLCMRINKEGNKINIYLLFKN